MQAKTTVISKSDIIAAVEGIRAALMNAYPAYIDLPEWEPAYLLIEEKLSLEVLESENF